ncbi:HEPN domain-containing protein [Leptolyngbya sp. PCC 6406]|uniref:HEPN domain-containing protein n=1 Tax=Leptolyngbya sp. PCC 6406 TaxID=1173264 RepID=UPI0002AC0488|nr:HEPN domain-containing protein [Leptolyngbya sp. PCC 6406]
MKNQRDLATGWFRKANSDLTTAQLMLASDGPYDTACYHAQQAAETYLKGFLAFKGIAIPRIHDLLELNQLCEGIADSWQVNVDSLAKLMPYAVESRYDLEFFPDSGNCI